MVNFNIPWVLIFILAMSDKPDSVPGLGFKDKDKAEETIKNLDGRDPDYQKLAIKGLVGRAKRTLSCKYVHFIYNFDLIY